MKVAVVQFDNRAREKLGDLLVLVARNRSYARRHGYDHFLVDKAYFDLPVYWQKPKVCRRFFDAGYDVVMWLDTDAVVHDVERPVADLFVGEEAMVAAPDPPHWESPFNAGVFLLRGPAGARILDRWAGLFPREAWERTETAWISHEKWAGLAFEQGAFTARLMPELLAAGELRLAEWSVLQAPFPTPDAFTLHFAGYYKANVPVYLHLIGAAAGSPAHQAAER